MGNTNLPQAGAADTGNSRDTLGGADQLTERQRKEGDDRSSRPRTGRKTRP